MKQWQRSGTAGRIKSSVETSFGLAKPVILSSSANGLPSSPTPSSQDVGRKSVRRGDTSFPSTSLGICTVRVFGTAWCLEIPRLCISRRRSGLSTSIQTKRLFRWTPARSIGLVTKVRAACLESGMVNQSRIHQLHVRTKQRRNGVPENLLQSRGFEERR